MQLITKEFLRTVGKELSEEETALLSDHFETTLNRRVVEEIVASLSGEQVETLAAMTERDDPAISDWLQQNVPELNEIIQDEVDILLGELVEHRESL